MTGVPVILYVPEAVSEIYELVCTLNNCKFQLPSGERQYMTTKQESLLLNSYLFLSGHSKLLGFVT